MSHPHENSSLEVEDVEMVGVIAEPAEKRIITVTESAR